MGEIPSGPTGVFLLTTSDSKLTVSFDSPISEGGDTITDYKVEWDREPLFQSQYTLPHKGYVELDASIYKSYTIPDLVEGLDYYVRVSARNSIGYGASVTATPQYRSPSLQVPGKPSNIIITPGSSEINL